MKKITFAAILAIFAFLIAPVDSHAKMQHFVASVYKMTNDGGNTVRPENLITSGITYQVLAIDSDTEETLYSDRGVTSKTNLVTTTVFNTQDRIDFWVDPTDSTDDTYVDLIVIDTNGGFTAFVENFSPSDRAVIIDERPNIQHHGLVPFTSGASSETDTGIDFLYDTRIESVFLEITTGDGSDVTMDVGLLSTETSGDANGFVAAGDPSTAGYVTRTLTNSGALLDNGTNFNPDGHIIRSANAKSLTYTASQSYGSEVGYIHYLFTRMR